MTRELSSDPQWDKIAWTEINTTTEWESEGIDSSAGSLSVSRLPLPGHSWVESYPEIRSEARMLPPENTPRVISGLSAYQTPCRLHAVIHLLQNNSFVLSFPSSWQKGTKAPQAAGKIHTDFEKGFIMAEVMKFQDFKEEGSESAVKVSSQSARGDEGKSPVISGADRHHTAPTENCSSPLLRGRNYCTHSSTTPDKPAGSDSKHCHCAPAVHIFITMCLNWLIVVPACGSDRGGTSLRICQSDTLLAWSYVWPNPKPLCSDGNMKRQV